MARLVRHWTFSARPGQAPDAWSLDGMVLSGPQRRMDLRDIQGAAFVDQLSGPDRVITLELADNGGRLPVTVALPADTPRDDPDRAAHLSLCRVVAGVIADIEPDMRVVTGMAPRRRPGLFGLGVVALLLGAGLPLGAYLTGTGTRLVGQMAVPLVILLAVGLVFAWTHRPGQPPPNIPAAALPAHLLKRR